MLDTMNTEQYDPYLITLQTTTASTLGKTLSPYKMNKDSHGVALIINSIEWKQDTNG